MAHKNVAAFLLVRYTRLVIHLVFFSFYQAVAVLGKETQSPSLLSLSFSLRPRERQPVLEHHHIETNRRYWDERRDVANAALGRLAGAVSCQVASEEENSSMVCHNRINNDFFGTHPHGVDTQDDIVDGHSMNQFEAVVDNCLIFSKWPSNWAMTNYHMMGKSPREHTVNRECSFLEKRLQAGFPDNGTRWEAPTPTYIHLLVQRISGISNCAKLLANILSNADILNWKGCRQETSR